MTTLSWIRTLFAGPARTARKAPARRRLAVEVLEDRSAPAVLVVNGTADTNAADAVLTLREAILLVNAGGDATTALGRSLSAGEAAQVNTSTPYGTDDTIAIPVAGTIALTGALPGLAKSVAIEGPGAGSLTVQRVSGGNYRLFTIPTGVTVSLRGLTLTGGKADRGGAVWSAGTLTVTNCTLAGNVADINARGGGIFNDAGTLTVTNCTLAGNFSSFLGGGIYTFGGTVTVTNSTLAGNVANDDGGGFYNQSGTVTVTNCTFSGNAGSTRSSHPGSAGGILNSGGALTLTNCTLSGNRASNGGGITNTGTLTVTNCTLSGNQAIRGGGILTSADTLTLNNSIVAYSVFGDDIHGAAVSGKKNLIGDGSGGLADTITGDPKLGPLANNGGPTQTHALLAGSPGLNAGDNGLVPVGLTTDQRGFARVFGGTVDIGAFESHNKAPTDIALSNDKVAENQPAGTAVGTLSTTDPNPGDTHTYALVSGEGDADNAAFEIVGNQLRTKAGFDFEAKSSYSIRVKSTDTYSLSTEEAFTISVTNVNEAPAVAVPAAQTAYEDVDLAITGVTVGDPEGDTLTVTLSVLNGTLTLGATAGLTFTAGDGTADAAMTFSGTITNIYAALAGLKYRGRLNFAGGDLLSVTASDGSLNTQMSVAISVKSAADQAAALRAKVTKLRDNGVLTRKQAGTLLATLALKGNDGDPGKVQSFLNEVRGLRQNGTLSAELAAELLTLGELLLLSVQRR